MQNIIKLSVGILVLLNTANLTAQQNENSEMSNPENAEKTMITQTQKNKEIVRKLYTTCLNTGNLKALDQVISYDYTANYKGKKVKGPSGYAETVKEVLQGFPDIRFTLEEVVAEDDMVSVQWLSEGTHTGSFFGFPATGKQVVHRAVAVYRLKDGKIVHNQVYPDRMGVLQQIGAMPEVISPTPKKTNRTTH